MLGVIITQGQRYQVNAKLLLQLGREMLPTPGIGAKDGTQVMPVSLRPEDTASEIELLSDPSLMRNVVASFDPAFFLTDPPATTLLQKLKAIPRAALRSVDDSIQESLVLLGLRPRTTPIERVMLALESAIDVEPVHKSDVIALKLTTADPQSGVVLLDRFINLAIKNHVNAYHRDGELTLLTAERAARNNDLNAAQAKLLAIQDQGYAAWLAPEQRSLLLKTVADLQLQNAQALSDAAQTEAEIGSIQAVLARSPTEPQISSVQTRNGIADELQRRLMQLRLDLVGLHERYTPESPETVDTQRQIEAITAALAEQPAFQVTQVTTGEDQKRSDLMRQLTAKQSQSAGLRARAAQITIQLDQLRQQLRSVQVAEIEVDRLEREIARLHRLIDLYDTGIDDARMSQAMETANISNLKVIMPPTSDLMPSGPSLKRFLILGFGGGLLLSVGAILLKDYAAPLRRNRSDAGTRGQPPDTAMASEAFVTVEHPN